MAATKKQRPIEGDTKQAALQRHQRRKAWFTAELQRQAVNRYQMSLDEEYKHGNQWTPQEAAAITARGQAPVVYNEIKPTIDWCIGTERRTRSDFLVTNRSDASEEAFNDAQVKTKLLKYLDDVNRTPFERSQVAVDMFTAGLGWLDTGIRENPEEEPVYARYESWRNVLHDSLGSRIDTEDWRYIFRFKEVDLDIAEAMFPDKGAELKKAVLMADRSGIWDWKNGRPWIGAVGGMEDNSLAPQYQTYDAEQWVLHPRDRVLLIECWEVAPFRTPADPGRGIDSLVKMRKRVSVQTEWDTLIEGWSPYAHNRFGLIPHFCYRRPKDGMPYGMVRNLRGPQDMLNKQMSKAVFRMATKQVLLEEGALSDGEGGMDAEDIRDEINAPDGVAVFANGALSGNRVRIEAGAPLAEADVRLADYNTQAIRQSSGVGGQQRGLETNVIAAKGIIAMQEQGSTLTAEPFDNLRLGRQLEGEIALSLIEQFYTDPKVFSVAGEQGRFEHQYINHPDPKTGQLNDVTARKAAFVIGEQPWKANLAEAAFQQTMELLGQVAPVAPQVVLNLLDLVFEFHPNLPNKFAMVQRIRAISGQTDPDGRMTPEQQAQKQQQAQVQQAQFQAQMAQLQADIREANAKGEKLEADAMLSRLTAIYESAQAAQVIAAAPGIAPIADEMLRSAGFKDLAGPPVQLVPPGAQIQQQPQQPPMGGDMRPTPPMQGDGAGQGIETQRPDGLMQGA